MLTPPPPPTERLFGRRDFQIFLSRCEILDSILKPPLEKILRTPLPQPAPAILAMITMILTMLFIKNQMT